MKERRKGRRSSVVLIECVSGVPLSIDLHVAGSSMGIEGASGMSEGRSRSRGWLIRCHLSGYYARRCARRRCLAIKAPFKVSAKRSPGVLAGRCVGPSPRGHEALEAMRPKRPPKGSLVVMDPLHAPYLPHLSALRCGGGRRKGDGAPAAGGSARAGGLAAGREGLASWTAIYWTWRAWRARWAGRSRIGAARRSWRVQHCHAWRCITTQSVLTFRPAMGLLPSALASLAQENAIIHFLSAPNLHRL